MTVPAAIDDGVAVRDRRRQDTTGLDRQDFQFGDEENEPQFRSNFKAERSPARVGEHKPAEGRWCGIVRIALNPGAKSENPLPAERATGEFVQPGKDTEPKGDTAPKSPAGRHLTRDAPLK